MQPFAKFKNIPRRGFSATLNFRKFKVALNPCRKIFLNYANVAFYHAYYNLIIKNGVNELVFELQALKAKIKGVLKLFTDDWALFLYHDFGINRYRVVKVTHQNLGKCWKLFRAILNWFLMRILE